MAYSPIAFVAPNYRDFKTYWLKAYEPNTTTPKVMALDAEAAITVAKLQLNADGFLESAGGALVIPYIDNAYDLWLFPTEAEADANDTSNADRVANDIIGAKSSLINDLSQAYEFATIQEMIDSTITFPDGKKISLGSYFANSTVGGGSLEWIAGGDKSSHDGILVFDPDVEFYTLGNQASVYTWYNGNSSPVGTGVFRRVFTGTVFDDWGGPLSNSSYVFDEAFVNRKLYEKILNNTSYKDFTFTPKDDLVWIVGSVNSTNSNSTIRHLAGCSIRGRYDDPVNHPGFMQAGHMFGFVSYVDPYPEGSDNSLTGDSVDGINYILDGDVSTEYSASHSQPHNNNAIAFFRGDDCSVTGTGGVSESDHNGISFDGFNTNPNVDVAYVKNYDNRAVAMKGDPAVNGSGRINIGTFKGSTLAGGTKESILVKDYDYVDVIVGDALLNIAGTGFLVWSQEVEHVDVTCGYVENASAICRLVNSGSVKLRPLRYRNVDRLVARESAGLPLTFDSKYIIIEDAVCLEGVDGTIYSTTYTTGNFKELRVENCDFEAYTGTLTPYAGKVAGSAPELYNFRNNKPPKGITGTHDGAPNAAVLTDTSKAFTVDEHIGKSLKNVTDRSGTTVTSNTATTVTGVLAGGSDNDWDSGDSYILASWLYDEDIFNVQLDTPNELVGSSSFTYDIAGENGDNPYQWVTIKLDTDGTSFIHEVIVSLKNLLIDAASHRYPVLSSTGDTLAVRTTRNGTIVTFTLDVTPGTGSIKSYSLSN